MTRFLAVFHEWHVSSRGFFTVELKASDREQAEAEAALVLRRRSGFYAMDFTLIPIGTVEQVRRRLTWRERFFGWLSHPF